MKQNEIEPRQNRVIYVLMAVIAGIGLLVALWYHARQ